MIYVHSCLSIACISNSHVSIKPIHFLILFLMRYLFYTITYYLFTYFCASSNILFLNEINDFGGIIGEDWPRRQFSLKRLLRRLISLKSGPGVMTINKIGRGNFLFHKGIYLL